MAGLADTTVKADRGPIDQNPSKIEPQAEKDAQRNFHGRVECFSLKVRQNVAKVFFDVAEIESTYLHFPEHYSSGQIFKLYHGTVAFSSVLF